MSDAIKRTAMYLAALVCVGGLLLETTALVSDAFSRSQHAGLTMLGVSLAAWGGAAWLSLAAWRDF